MKRTAIRYSILSLFIITFIFGAGLEKGSGKRINQYSQDLSDADLDRIRSIIDQQANLENLRSKVETSVDQRKRILRQERPQIIDKGKPASERLKTAFHKSLDWQDFGRKTVTSERVRYAKSSASVPTVFINSQSVVSIDPGEEFEITATFSDSALVEMYYDANGDTLVDSGDLNLFDLNFPFDEGMPEGDFTIYDNDWEDEDATIGAFKVTVQELPYMGIPVILRITDAGGSGTAYLDIASLQGHTMVSGHVETGNSNPAMVFLAGDDDDAMFMTFADTAGDFSFNSNAKPEDFMIGAVDAYLTVETGQFLAKISTPWMYGYGANEVEMHLDVTRDAAARGTVLDESLNGLSGAQIGAGGMGYGEAVIAFTRSDTSGQFILPLQSGAEYMIGSMHPDYMGSGCVENSLIPSPGDTITISCNLEPWPAFVQGTVTDINTGDPIADIEIELHIWGHDSTNNDSTHTGDGNFDDDFFFDEDYWRYSWTDDEGFYRIGTLMGSGWICAYDWDRQMYQTYCLNQLLIDQVLITEDISMTPWDGLITGTVTDSVSGAPIPGASVYLSHGNSDSTYHNPLQWTEADEDGYFEIPAMNGEFRICASFWDYGYQEICDSVAVNNDTVMVALKVLPPDGLIFGYVTDAVSGDSLSGVNVDIHDNWNGYRHTVTDSTGYYEFGVDNGEWNACFYSYGKAYEDTCINSITVSNDSTQVNVTLVPITFDGAITGTVKNESGDPVLSMVVGIDTSGNVSMMTINQNNGAYFLPLDNGIYLAAAIPLDHKYMPVYDSVTVFFDTTIVNFTVSVPVPDAVIYGVVEDTLGNPLEGAQIIASNSGYDNFGPYGYMAFGQSDENGNYKIEVIGNPDSYYWMAAQYIPMDSMKFLFTYIDQLLVLPGDSIRLDLELSPDGGGYHDGDHAVHNSRGNFRFGWDGHGRVMGGEWPKNSGTHYLADGGLALMGLSGTMNEDTIFAGLASVDTGEVWEAMGGWTNSLGIVEDHDGEAIYRGMSFQHGVLHGLDIQEYIVYPDSTDFVVVLSQIKNVGADDMTDVIAGYGMDWDVTYSESIDTYEDDMSGSKTIYAYHPLLAVDLPVKVSWMKDDDGDNGASPGVAAQAMITHPDIAVRHRNIDLNNWEPETPEDMAELMLGTVTDDTNSTTPSDYAIAQFASFGNLASGDSVGFFTVIMVAEDTADFATMVEKALALVYGDILAVNEPANGLPETFSLEQNYPNPFNPITRIQYSLIEETHVTLSIFNLLGQEVIRLVDKSENAGVQNVTWNGRNAYGDPVSGGIYFYRLQAGEFVRTRKMLYLK